MSELKPCPVGTKVCDLCNGKGKITATTHDWTLDEPRMDEIVCLRCKGKGFVESEQGAMDAWNENELEVENG